MVVYLIWMRVCVMEEEVRRECFIVGVARVFENWLHEVFLREKCSGFSKFNIF